METQEHNKDPAKEKNKITKHTWTQTKEKTRDTLKSNEVGQGKRHSVVKAAHWKKQKDITKQATAQNSRLCPRGFLIVA